MTSAILENIDGHIFRDVGGYWEKYFGASHQKEVAAGTTPDLLVASTKNGVQNVSKLLTSWLESIASLHGLHWQQSEGAETGIAILQLKERSDQHQAGSSYFVRALGIVTDQEQDLYRKGFAELCKAAGILFVEDPLRLFTHAFIVWGTIVELWTIDRSGLYSCKPFDICNDPTRFIHIISTYALAEVSHLGANPVRQLIDSGSMILESETHRSNGIEPVQLIEEPLDFDNDCLIINRSPTIYFSKPTASGFQVVAKYKWRKEFEYAEGDIFKSMGDMTPRGVANLYNSEDIESTSTLRAGLQFGCAVKLLSDDQVPQTTGSSNELPNIFTQRHPDSMGDEAYMERVWSCTAVYPIGHGMKYYETPSQIITAFRDVLGGLRDLYQKCKILHRDVSVYNMLLTDPSKPSTEENPPKGFLIDFEGALDLKHPPKRNQIGGTTPFMAIGLLRGRLPHTYRYDLESFFYSFIWFCVQPRTMKIEPPKDSRLWRWRGRSDEQRAENKLQDMQSEHFQMILDEFHPDLHRYRGLADGIRKLLFPVQPDGSLDIETDETEAGSNALYEGIMQEFASVIEQEESQYQIGHLELQFALGITQFK